MQEQSRITWRIWGIRSSSGASEMENMLVRGYQQIFLIVSINCWAVMSSSAPLYSLYKKTVILILLAILD
jgi:hypothetical protein